MAQNEHIMTTRSKKRSRSDTSDNSNTTVTSCAASYNHTTRSTISNKTKAAIGSTNTANTSRFIGKKPAYNPDPDSGAEENIAVYKTGTGEGSTYDPDPGSDAEENITALESATTTKPKASKGKEAQGSTSSGSINDDMLALAIKNFKAPPPQPNVANSKIPTKQKSAAKEPDFNTSRDEVSDPASSPSVPEPRAVHPDYQNLPLEVPVDDEGIRKSKILLYPGSMRDAKADLESSHSILFQSQRKSADLG